MNMKVFKVFIVVAILVIPVMLLGVSCKNEESASKELAFEPALQDSMTTGQPLYAEAEEDDTGASYESEEQEGQDTDAGYEFEEEEGEDPGYEPEEGTGDEEPAYEPEEDEHA
jgi:hypothetical protein